MSGQGPFDVLRCLLFCIGELNSFINCAGNIFWYNIYFFGNVLKSQFIEWNFVYGGKSVLVYLLRTLIRIHIVKRGCPRLFVCCMIIF